MIQNAQIRVMSENLPEARPQRFYDAGDVTKNFARGLSAISSFAEDISGAVAKWGADLQAESDKEKLAELELMQSQIDHEVELQAQDAPERYDRFAEDATAIEETYAERRKELLDGLSEKGRLRANIMLADRGENRAFNVAKLSRRAAVEYGFKQSEKQVNSYIDLGNYENAHKLVDNYASGEDGTPLYSADQAKTMHEYIDRKQQYNAIAGAAGNSGSMLLGGKNIPVSEALIARNENGTFKHFPLISDKERSELVRVSKEQDQAFEYRFAAQLKDGSNQLTEDGLKQMHASGMLSDRRYDHAVQMLRAHDQGIANLRKAQREEKEKEEKARTEAQKKADADAKNAFQFGIVTTDFSTDPAINRQQVIDLKDEVSQRFSGKPETLKTLYEAIDERGNAALSGGDEFSTPEGKALFNMIQKTYIDSNGKYKDLEYDDPWYRSPTNDSQEFMQARCFELFDRGRALIASGKSAREAWEILKPDVDKMEQGKLASLIAEGSKYRPSNIRQQFKEKLPKEENIEVGTTRDGKKVIRIDGKTYYAK